MKNAAQVTITAASAESPGAGKNMSAHLADGNIVAQVPWLKLGGGPGTGLVMDPDGGIWTGLLSGGMAYFRAGQIRNLPLSDDGVSAPRVLDVARDRDGSIWAATNNGVSRINNGRVATLTTANGLPCNTVHWISEDDLSSYWLYTQCGLLRVARTDMDSWIADPKRAIRPTRFDVEDGIRLVPILKGLRPAVTKASDGRIWFVNGEKVSFIDPSRNFNTLPPPVH
jgi:ligand-binding sensor domain-containing protein